MPQMRYLVPLIAAVPILHGQTDATARALYKERAANAGYSAPPERTEQYGGTVSPRMSSGTSPGLVRAGLESRR